MENLLGSFQSKKKKHGFLFVGSIYIKRKPIIVLIEQDLGHDMGFKFEDFISKMVREKLFFNSCFQFCFYCGLYSKEDFLIEKTEVGNGYLTEVISSGLSNNF